MIRLNRTPVSRTSKSTPSLDVILSKSPGLLILLKTNSTTGEVMSAVARRQSATTPVLVSRSVSRTTL